MHTRRRRSRTRFQYWGTLLAAVVIVFATQGAWPQAMGIGAVWLGYLLFVRLTRCRVETLAHRPCRWLVRGLLGTCEYHVGDKRGFPVLWRTGPMSAPRFMWRRTSVVPGALPEPQPAGSGAESSTSRRAASPTFDVMMAVVAILGLVVATLSFLRDLIAG